MPAARAARSTGRLSSTNRLRAGSKCSTLAELAPELRLLLGRAEAVGAEAGVEVADDLGARILDCERGRMRIGDQHQALAQRAHPPQELARSRQPADVVRIAVLERGDIQLELAAPVVDAVPVERAFARAKARLQLGLRLLRRSSSARAPRPAAPACARSDCRTPDRAACRPGRAARSRSAPSRMQSAPGRSPAIGSGIHARRTIMIGDLWRNRAHESEPRTAVGVAARGDGHRRCGRPRDHAHLPGRFQRDAQGRSLAADRSRSGRAAGDRRRPARR